MATEYSERLEKIEKKLAAKKEQLEKINEDLEEYKGLEKKDLSGNTIVRPFNKLLSRALRSISSLNATKEVLEKEIAELTADRDELEFNLSYFEDFKQNLDELPENSGDFLKELKNQVNTIEELRNKTEDNIKSVNKVIQKIEKSITEFTKLLKDSFEKFDKDYPSYIKDEFEKIINENGVLADLPSLKNFIADYVLLADTKKEISLSKDKIAKLSDQINDLYKDFLDIQQEYDTKKLILDKFQAVADAYQTRKAEENKMMENEQLLTEALGTADTGVQTVEFNKEYEPTAKKSDEIIPRGTMGIVRGKPHQVRANTFGFNLNRFDNRKNIRGVYVTSKNEDQLVPGLTDMLRMDEAGLINEDINKDEIIALVMVIEDENGNVIPVGVDGQPIPKGVEAVDAAIYQVFPDGDLKWGAEFDNKSMFRNPTEEGRKVVIDSITKQYKEWRTSVIGNPDLSERHEIEASFGRVENVTDADGKIIYDTRTSVQDANLITTDELEGRQLITIPTLPTEGSNIAIIEQGTVTFRVPVGTVLLETPNGLVKLQNKQHSEKEAETIYEAILQLAKNMLDPQVGIKDAKSERLLNWLKSTVYWGLPENQNKERKPAGYNSVFFEKDSETGKLMLTLSGKGKDFVFTPTALEENKDAIVLMLSNMYNNINNHFAKQLNEPYEEILSISESGEITSRIWKNYQSYLLSNQTPDGKVRSGEELPLSTTVRPTVNNEDINRTNIYFFTTDTADNFVIPVVEKKKVVTPKVLTPGAPTPTVTPVSTDAKVDVKGTLTGQGTSLELEVVGDTGKEFLLTVDRKGNISLFSEKQSDGSYKSGEPASKEAVDKLYNKYIPEKTRTVITNWLNSFTGSWAAPETQDGKNYDKAEKVLNAELAVLEEQPTVATPALISPVIQSSLDMLSKAQELLDAQSKRFEKYIPAVQKYLDTKKQQLQDPKLTVEQREKIAKTIEMDMKIPIVSLNNLVLEFAPNGRPEKIYINNPETKESYNFTTYFQENGERNFKNNPNYAFNPDERLGQGSSYGYDIVTKNSIIPIEGLNLREAETLRHFLSGADSGATQYAAHDTDNLGQGLLMGVIKHYFIEKAAGRMQRDFWDYLQDPRKEMREQIEAKPVTAAVLQPNTSALAQAQGTARTEPVTTATPVTYKLDGSTPQTYTSPEGKKIMFTASANTTAENANTEIKILKGGDLDEVVAKIKAAGKDPGEILKKTVFNAIAPTLNEMKAMEADLTVTIPDDVEEVVVADAESKMGKPISQSVMDAVNRKISGLDNEALRVVIEKELKAFVPENWSQVETWLKSNFPNVPVYRVKNIIQATNGRQAWGMFKDGAIYIYENAEVGTVYHEVFHAVWRMFSDPTEQKAVLDEMKSRSGKFYDRASMNDVSYSEATEDQLEEKLAEEFRDYVQFKKIPAKPSKGRPYILKLFADMVTAIKEFFIGPQSNSKVEKMFSQIGQGYYKSHVPFQNSLAFAKEGVIDIEDAFADSDAALSLAGINDKERSDIIQHMTYLTLVDLIKTDESLFNIEKRNKKQVYAKLKDQVLETISQKIRGAQSLVSDGEFTQEEVNPLISNTLQLMQNVEDQWSTITERHEEYLKSYAIEFDENDNINLKDENNSGRETYQDATKIDNFKKSNSAVKILLATIPEVDDNGKLVPSSIGGAKLLPVSKTYISMMNNLHTSASVEEMLGRLRQMAVSDPNYRTLYRRITKRDWKDGGVDLSKVDTQHALQLISSIWNTFKKQNPDVRNVFILENGEVVVGEANLSSAAQQLRSEYINSIVFKAKEGKGFFTYDNVEKVFKGDPAKLKGVNLNSVTAMVDFLNRMGIPFTVSDVNKMTPEQYKVFKAAVAGIKESISRTEKIATFSGKALGMSGRLLELGLVKSAVSNPEFSSTYFNVSGERTQSFIGTNAASDLSDFLSKLERFNKESVGGTRYSYLLTDSFAKGSNLLSRMFTDAGTRKKDTEDLFKIGYVSGLVNEEKGKRKESSKLTYKDRLVQELNLNLSGYYLNLVPGDASIEWMIKMGNAISTASISRGMDDINAIFKEYFKAELELVRENRSVAKGRKSDEMRFFKGILGDTVHSDVLAAKGTPEEVYKAFEDKINGKLSDFIQKDMIKLKQSLTQYGILKEGMLGFDFENINLPKNIGEKEVDKQLMALTANYMIANIEMHKLLYSDPYQYEDELKRIKSFNSPRQAIINNSPKMNAALSNVWNKGFKAGDIGFTKFTQDYFRSATHADVIGIIDLPNYTSFKETDGSGIINMKANRQFRIRAGNWNSEEERQYRYDVAWEKRDKNLPLLKEEVAILAAGNPGIQSAYTPLKPIVSGSKLAKNGTASSYNDVVLDKFALYPLSYRIMKEIDKDANAIKLYDKMQREDIDYVVFTSGRKVGAESPHETYKDGAFNDDPYKGIINVPFSIMSIQAEVPSKEDNLVTRGSQITKLITLDFMEAGVPVDFFSGQPFANRYKAWYKLSDAEKVEKSELYKEIKNNQDILEALIEEGYKNTLDKLGIKETITKDKDGNIVSRKFEITDFSKAAQTLRDEILKREVNDNISDALAGFLQGKVVLEATPAYQQVRNIIYSIADKQFISPKISGGMKVQIPSTMLESGVRNVKDGLYESDVLDFYVKDGKRVAEVMLGRWFDSPLSDEELLEYLNTTEEGQKILAGVGYRIPTQKQNSVDVIIIKKFLPKEFGDSVVIPAALVQKVGSDFDIDKLSVYLKNVYVKNGKPRLIPYFGIGEQAINKFTELFDKGEFLTEEEMKELDRYIAEEQLLLQDVAEESASGKLMSSVFGKLFSEEELTQEFTRGIPSKDQIISRLYKKSLENEYIQSMENLITHPKNYDNLIKPNSAESLKELSEEIAGKTVGQSFDYKNVDNMLDRTFMSRLRHAFVTGKYAIGIAAVNQTNHSLNQRQPIYIDKSRLSRVSEEDRFWLGNADIRFDKYNAIEIDGKMVPTLSMITNKAGEYISDIIGMFIDGYVDISKGPWIMELGATPNVASTWLFLIKAGVPVKSVAYFMNQPMIRDYLRSIESAGYSWLFMDTFVNLTAESYGLDMPEAELQERLAAFKIPGETTLKNNVGKSPSSMNSNEKMEQYLMLREFLKYAKMGEQMFHVTQGSNYDTSSFNDPYLVFKKQMQQIKAQNTIISSVDTLLSNSFIGKLAETVNSVRDAFAQIIKSDSPKVRNVIQKVLLPYVETSDREFVKLAQKAVGDLFDWAVQTDQNLNEMIKDILVNDGGVGREVAMFVNEVKSKGREHPLFGNHVIDIIEGIPSIKAAAGGPNNAKLNMGENKVYDQNNVIYAFRELRDYLKGENNPLYERIKLLAVLQSGLSPSPISFTNLIPYEDFENIYNKTLSKLEGMPNLEDFYKLGVFQRNNWNNDDVVPYLKAALIKTEAGRMHYNPSMKFLPDAVKQAMASNNIPPILTRSKMNREANSDYIVYTWEKQEELLTKEELDKAIADRNVYKAIAAKKAEMRRAADYSYINKALFKKVYDNYNTALEHTAYDGKKYFVYKAINAWGDSFRANEFWATDHKSVIENGFMKVEDVDNNVIISKFLENNKSKTSQKTTEEKKDIFTC